MVEPGGSSECNVRVVVRVRPLVARERLAGAVESLHLVPGTPQIVAGSDHSYSFDHVPKCNQDIYFIYVIGIWK